MSEFQPFSIARLPRIEFGSGRYARVPGIVAGFGSRALLVTGGGSLRNGPYWEPLLDGLAAAGVQWSHCVVPGEPSPEMVDQAVSEFAGGDFDVVLAVGGGSALDAGKAIAGLLRVGRSVMDYLEGVGPELAYQGPAVPLVAVPTTAGTGSEATRNAVLSRQGPDGFKKSFRHDSLVAEYAVVDPDLLSSCPPEVIAANGMDAFTQLLESYVSPRGNPMCDALGLSALQAARDGLLALYQSNGEDGGARERMAYASLISGINLAQTGLGSVHGLASPLGAYYPIPHGVVCGTLVAECTRVNIAAMQEREPDNPALGRYAKAGATLMKRHFPDQASAHQALLERLDGWTRDMHLPGLGEYGLTEDGFDAIVAGSRGNSMKTNPILLSDAEVRGILERRLKGAAMRRRRLLGWLALVPLVPLVPLGRVRVARAAETTPDALELLRRSERLMRGDSNISHYRIRVVRPDWQRLMKVVSHDDRLGGRNRVEILAPRKSRGTVFLRRAGRLSMYLPKLRRSVAISPAMMQEPWMGSDFNNQDILEAGALIDLYDHRIREQQSQGDERVYRIESRPKPDAPVVWSRLEQRIREDGVPLELLYFGADDELLRRMEFSPPQPLGGRSLPLVWRLTDLGREGHFTELTLDAIRFDEPLDDALFERGGSRN